MTKNGSKTAVKDKESSKTQIANEVIFYGEKNCITCSYVLPLINYGIKNNWFRNASISILKTKKEYKEKIRKILEKYDIHILSFPVVEMITFESKKGLVDPHVLENCAQEIIDRFKVLGEDAFLDYLEDGLKLDQFFANQILRMATNLIYLDDVM